MLKGKRGVSACSLSSCRIRAEALARAFNSRIWPCVWVSKRSSAEGDGRMSNGIDDEEEFFDASPSPVEVEDESLFCQQHSSAATEAGRAKLYELLQQHATDDVIDVFYDVSEDAGLTDTDTCLKGDGKESEQVDKICESSVCCRLLDDEPNFSNEPDICDSDGKENELMLTAVNQSSDESINREIPDNLELSNGETDSDPSKYCSPDFEYCPDDTENSDVKSNEESSENSLNQENNILQENESANTHEEDKSFNVEEQSSYTLKDENKIPKENDEEDIVTNEVAKNDELPSENYDCGTTVAPRGEETPLNAVQELFDNVTHSANEETVSKSDEENNVAIEITAEIDSPSAASDTADAKVISPTSRLQVFDESRPKISRSTSLKTGKTPPGTPSRKKIVRFADVLGLDLEDVRHIMTGDVPIIPSSAYTDLDLKGTDFPSCETISETVEISRRDSASWKSMPGLTASNVLYPMFAIPGQQPDFLDRVRNQL